MDKERIRIRLHVDLQEVIECEAAWRGIRVGTLANRILQEELEKLCSVNADHILIEGTPEYEDRVGEIEQNPKNYYLLPDFTLRERYTPNNGRGIDSGTQISLYITKAQHEALNRLAEQDQIRGTLKLENGKTVVVSYRYVLTGLFLNSAVMRKALSVPSA